MIPNLISAACLGAAAWVALIFAPAALFMASGGARYVSESDQIIMLACLCAGVPLSALAGLAIGWLVAR